MLRFAGWNARTTADVADTSQRIHVAQGSVSTFEVLVFRAGDMTEVSHVLRSDDVCAVAYFHSLKPQPSPEDALRFEVKAHEVFCCCIFQMSTVVTCTPAFAQREY